MGELMKTERVLEGILCNLLAVQISLCDSDTKNEVQSMTIYAMLEKKLDSMGLLSMIKKLVYNSNTNDINTRQNKAITHMNLMNLYQENLWDVQDFGTSM